MINRCLSLLSLKKENKQNDRKNGESGLKGSMEERGKRFYFVAF
jgi:hypothetical protein